MSKPTYLFLIGGIFSLMVAMGIGRFAYTPLLPLMQNDLAFSNAVAGYLATSNYAGYLVGAILAGVLPLKKHKTVYLRLSLIVSIITTFSMGLTYSYIIMVALRFISGVSSAFIFVLASSIVLDRLAAKDKTNYAGLFYSGVGLGIFLSGLIVPTLNHSYQWEGAWIGLAVVSGFLTFFVWIWLKDTANFDGKKNTQLVSTNSKIPPVKWLPWLIAAYGLEGLGYIVTGTFIVSIAEETSAVIYNPSFVWVIVGLAAFPSCIIWSLLAKKFGFVQSLVIAMTIQAIGIAMPVLWISQVSLTISAILFGATFMGITTLATTLARQMNPSNSNKIIGLLTAMYAIGQMIGPTIAGVLSTYTDNFNLALIGAASVVLIGGVLLLSGCRFEKKTRFKGSVGI